MKKLITIIVIAIVAMSFTSCNDEGPEKRWKKNPLLIEEKADTTKPKIIDLTLQQSE